MAAPSTPSQTATTLSLRPVTSPMPDHVSFGATPTRQHPQDSPNPPETTLRTALKTSGLNCMSGNVAAKFVTDSVPAKKSISAVDKVEEAQMAKLYALKTKIGVVGVADWLHTKVKGGGEEK